MSYIYTALFGKVEKNKLMNETSKGYRVTFGSYDAEKIVFKNKLFSGWKTQEDKTFFTQCSFKSKNKAESFANKQILCMKKYYEKKLQEIVDLEEKLTPKNRI